MEGSRVGFRQSHLLIAKVLSTLGYAVVPEVENRVGSRRRCALLDGTVPPPAGSLGDTAPCGDEECDVVVVGSGAGGAVAAARSLRLVWM